MPAGKAEKDKKGQTRLHRAVLAADLKEVESVLKDQTQLNNINELDNNQNTALHLASRGPFCNQELNLYHSKDKELIKFWEQQYVAIIALLIENGADYTIINSAGETPLCLAVRDSRSVAVIIALRNRGADLRVRNAANETLFHLAVSAKRNVFEIVTYLITTDAFMKSLLNAEDTYGNVPMHLLLAKSTHDSEEPEYNKIRFKLLSYLVEQGVSIKAQNDFCETPIHLCIENSADALSFKLLEKLLNHADTKWIINNRVLEGFTALHLAAKGASDHNKYNYEFIKLILKAGADPHLKTYDLELLEDCLPKAIPEKERKKLVKLFNSFKNNQSENLTDNVLDKEIESIFLGETQLAAFRKILNEVNLKNIDETLLKPSDYPDLYKQLLQPARYEELYVCYQDVYAPLTGTMTTLEGGIKRYDVSELASDIKLAKRAISWGTNYRDHLQTYIFVFENKIEKSETAISDSNIKLGKQEELSAPNAELTLLKRKLAEIKKAQRIVINHISFMEQIMKRAYDAAKGPYILDRLGKRYIRMGDFLRSVVETKLKQTLNSLQQVQQPPSKKIVLTNFSDLHSKLEPKDPNANANPSDSASSKLTQAELLSSYGHFKPAISDDNSANSEGNPEIILDPDSKTEADATILKK